MTKTNKRHFNFVKVSPTGNVTILIFDDIPRNEHASTANILMDENHLFAEQVGYFEEPSNSDAIARLQMMGGEFCGNATRSMAAVLVSRNYSGIVFNEDRTEALVKLEVSGYQGILTSKVGLDESGAIVSAASVMPIKSGIDCVKSSVVIIDGQKISVTLVELEGISHVIVNSDSFVNPNYTELLISIRDQLGLGNLEAMGVLFCSDTDLADISMNPIVYVRETDTIIPETACGSGTVALGLSKAIKEGTSVGIDVLQPSGGIIRADIDFDGTKFVSASISGSVDIIAEGTVYI